MTSQLPRFWCFFLLLVAEKKDTENGAAVTSLRSFLFRDYFRTYPKHEKAESSMDLRVVSTYLIDLIKDIFSGP